MTAPALVWMVCAVIWLSVSVRVSAVTVMSPVGSDEVFSPLATLAESVLSSKVTVLAVAMPMLPPSPVPKASVVMSV